MPELPEVENVARSLRPHIVGRTITAVETSGKKICVPMTVWIHFEDGLIKGEAAYLDGHELRHQIVHGTDKRQTTSSGDERT